MMIQKLKVLRLKRPNQVVYIPNPSNPKRQALMRKGMASIAKQPCLIFSKVNGTCFLPYEFRAIEIDKLQGQEQVTEQSLVDEDLQIYDARNQEENCDMVLGSHPEAKHNIIHHMQSS